MADGQSDGAAERGSFRDFLAGDGVALFDGAMGTILYAQGAFINRPFEELNLIEPIHVREVHESYVAAGADILETNTFAANRFRLSPHGLEGEVEHINRRAVEIAREASAGRCWVAGAMGPLGVRIEPFGPIGKDEARQVFAEQASALAAAGVDLFVLETFTHLPELLEAVAAVRSVSELPIVAQLQFSGGGVTREGVVAEDAAAQLVRAGVDVVGVNCSEALASLQALAELREATDRPLSVQPNAGQPKAVEGRRLYLGSPDYFVAWGRRALRSGARLLGGCCGTTPEHIKALAALVADRPPVMPPSRVQRAKDKPPAAAPIPRQRKSVLSAALADGRFVTGVELPPVRGWVLSDMLEKLREAALAGCSFASIPEGAAHGANLPPLVVAHQARQLGMGTIIHYSCRGRRLSRMQSDLLGAAASGVVNVLGVTGDPLTPGAEPDAWPDLEVDSIGLVNLLTRLNHGEDIGGNPIGRPTEFHIGVRLDPTNYDMERELKRLFWKIDAGAEYAVTSPVFDAHALAQALKGMSSPIPVIATIWPLQTARSAEFFEHEMVSVPVPEPFVERMRRAEERGNEEAEGLRIAREVAAAVRPLVQGIQVVAPDGRIDLALSVLEALR